MKFFLLLSVFLAGLMTCGAQAQSTYKDSMKRYIKNYIDEHKVVQQDDKKHMQFFEVNKKFRVLAQFEKIENGEWFQVPTSGKLKQMYRVYGKLKFRIGENNLTLNLLQSQRLMGSEEYKNYLFLPFTDATTGKESYETGRYIDLRSEDIKDNLVIVDFNKAYNPLCAYVSDVYNCPIPPKENHLTIAIKAGEKKYGKH